MSDLVIYETKNNSHKVYIQDHSIWLNQEKISTFAVKVLHLWFTDCMMFSNKTRQGYARKCILKPAGYSFQGLQS